VATKAGLTVVGKTETLQ